MDFKQIEAFANVVRYKSFSKAAEVSFVSQPTISTHVSSLEKELNMQLIDRNFKEALPTKQGRVFYKYAINMLNIREKAINSVKDVCSDISGIVEIQASSIPGEYIIPPILSNFREIYDDVKFYVEESDSMTVTNNILNNKGEIGFVGHKSDKNLVYHELLEDRIVLITPKTSKYLERQSPVIKIHEFIDEPIILREQGSGTMKEFERNLMKYNYSSKQLNVVCRMNNVQSIINAVSNGLGVSMISKIAAMKCCKSNDILYFNIENMNSNRMFYMVYSKKTSLSPTAEAFKNFVLSYSKINNIAV